MAEQPDDRAELEALMARRAEVYRLEPGAEAATEAAALWDRAWKRPPTADLAPARAAAGMARERGRFTLPHVEASSRLPGGAAVHQAISRSVERHLDVLVRQLDHYGEAVADALDAVVAILSAGVPHEHPDLVAHLERLGAHLDELRRGAS